MKNYWENADFTVAAVLRISEETVRDVRRAQRGSLLFPGLCEEKRNFVLRCVQGISQRYYIEPAPHHGLDKDWLL